MMDAERIAKVRLIRTENVGVATFSALMARFGSAREALLHLPDFARLGGRKRSLTVCSESTATAEIDRLYNAGGEMLFKDDAAYPALLKALPDAPPVLSVLGNKALLNTPSVAVVGTRNATINGKKIARTIANDLVKSGYTVVSGMAVGIDAAAHEGALFDATPKSSTVAVLGTGLNIPYPAQNRKLYDEIREKGLLVSEYALDTKPQPANFPHRNRIISGIANGLVVIEATLRSGSLITANRALEQGKEVFAVPATPTDERAKGVNHLIKTGAPLVESADDIIAHLTGLPMLSLNEPAESEPVESFAETAERNDLSADGLLERLDGTPTDLDALIRETGLPAPAISVLLVELELAGRIERLPGNRIIRISTGQ